MWGIEDIKRAIVVVLDVNIEIVSVRRANMTRDVALSGVACVHGDRVGLADLYGRL